MTNLLRLLELNPDVKRLIERGELEMGHARALLGLKGPEQSSAANRVSSQGLSVRDTEKLVRRLQQSQHATAQKPAATAPDPNIRQLQDNRTEKLGARVLIQHGAQGRGKLVISYNSPDELEGILEHIR